MSKSQISKSLLTMYREDGTDYILVTLICKNLGIDILGGLGIPMPTLKLKMTAPRMW